MAIELDLSGRVVIVTGGGSGIGRAACLQLARAGATVVVSDIAESAHEATAMIADVGGAAVAAVGDISDQQVAETLVADTIRDQGAVDVLVNNAGVMDLFSGAATTTNEVWERVIRINLEGPFFLTRAVLPHMCERGRGSIVNVASEAGVRGGAAGAAYTVSKHGLVGLTRSTAWQYAKDGVRTNAICPGGVETNVMTPEIQAHIDQDGLGRLGPVHGSALRMAQPDEIAALIVFLAADASSNVNGAIIPADGGWSAG